MPKLQKPIRPMKLVDAAAARAEQTTPLKNVSSRSKRSVYLILVGLPLFLVSSVVLYRRVLEGESKRVQLGEYTPDGGLRLFTPEEREEKDKQTLLTRIFGKDR